MIPGYLLAGIGIDFLQSCITLDYFNKGADKTSDYKDALDSLSEFSTWSQLIVVIMCIPLFFVRDQVDKSLEQHAQGETMPSQDPLLSNNQAPSQQQPISDEQIAVNPMQAGENNQVPNESGELSGFRMLFQRSDLYILAIAAAFFMCIPEFIPKLNTMHKKSGCFNLMNFGALLGFIFGCVGSAVLGYFIKFKELITFILSLLLFLYTCIGASSYKGTTDWSYCVWS